MDASVIDVLMAGADFDVDVLFAPCSEQEPSPKRKKKRAEQFRSPQLNPDGTMAERPRTSKCTCPTDSINWCQNCYRVWCNRQLARQSQNKRQKRLEIYVDAIDFSINLADPETTFGRVTSDANVRQIILSHLKAARKRVDALQENKKHKRRPVLGA